MVNDFRRPKPRNAWNELTHSRFGTLLILFCVTGFLGLPLLWLSPVFSKREKWIWAIINVLYTLTLILITGRIVMWAWGRLSDAFY